MVDQGSITSIKTKYIKILKIVVCRCISRELSHSCLYYFKKVFLNGHLRVANELNSNQDANKITLARNKQNTYFDHRF